MYYYLLLTVTLFFFTAASAGSTPIRGGVEATEDITPTAAPYQLQTQTLSGTTDSFQIPGNVQITPIGLASQLGKMILAHHNKHLKGTVNTELYCVGLATYGDTGRILWIDPHCQVYGILQVGDVIDSMDGERVLPFTMERKNYASSAIPVKLHVTYQDGRQEYRLCSRVPVASVDSRGMLPLY